VLIFLRAGAVSLTLRLVRLVVVVEVGEILAANAEAKEKSATTAMR
jgi:hypothetical protein